MSAVSDLGAVTVHRDKAVRLDDEAAALDETAADETAGLEAAAPLRPV